MNENTGPKDQSMDEILGSIRRIINEDNAQSGGARVAPEDNDAAGDDEDEEEVLDLTEEVPEDEQEAPRPESSFGEPQEPSAEAGPRREPVLGLHSPAQQPAPAPWDEPMAAESTEEEQSEPFGEKEESPALSPVEAEHPEDATEESAETVTEMEPEIGQAAAAEPEPATGMPPAEPQPAPQTPATEISASRPEIVSETATAATASAIGELTRAMEEKSSKLKVGADEATISDIVKEMLRPMLREWMDENLPVIVERIVRREIQKLVDRAEDDD